MKILIIGFGSIGQRHFNNLKSLGYENVYVYDSLPEKIKDQKLKIENLDKKNLEGFDVAFVCNPNHLHVETALKCAEAGLHLFIEKPLSHNLKGINKLQKIVEKKKLVNMVACNFHFNEGFSRLNDLIREGNLGKPISVRVVIGQDLTVSRKGVDYRQTYAAQKIGGGVILDSGAHAVHYLSALFGDVKKEKIVGTFGNLSNLEISSEDFASFDLVHKNGVVSSVTLDYFSRPKRHNVEVQFEKGSALWDFAESKFSCYDEGTKKKTEYLLYKEFSLEDRRNLMYLEELKAFVNILENNRLKSPQDLNQAKDVLEILQLVKNKSKKI